MANIKFEIDGKVYDFAPESFVIDNEGNIILKSKSKPEKRNPFERVKEGESFYFIGGDERLMTNEGHPWDCIDGCTAWSCKDDFEISIDKIKQVAEDYGLSITDITALIDFERRGGSR